MVGTWAVFVFICAADGKWVHPKTIKYHVDYRCDDPTHLGNVPSIEDNPWHPPYFLCRGDHCRDYCFHRLQ